MCYTKKDRELEKEACRITESRLMEEEARHRHEDHNRRRRRARREEAPDREGQGSGGRQVGRAL
jgi:hypothetical protein